MKSIVIIFSAVLLVSLCGLNDSKNILGLFPHPGYSHFKVFYPILQTLAEKGHNLTVVTYVKSKNINPNYHELILTGEDTIHLFSIEMFTPSRSLWAMFHEYFLLSDEGDRACKVFYEAGVVEEILKINQTNPFDLVITENFNTDCYLGVPYILNVPVVALSSCAIMPWHYDRFGLPDIPSYIPSEFVGFNEYMSFYERFANFLVVKGTNLLYRMITQSNDNKFIKNHLKIDVDVVELAKKQSLMLVNQHYSFSGSRPIPSRVVEIGGVHINDHNSNKIPKNLENFLQQSKNGVIFISWGSLIKISTLGKSKVEAIIKALEKLPYDIIWKWETDNFPTKNKKFMFIQWAPQMEVLCHPKMKIFWSHGGLLGASESVHCGKPIIVTPLYGDQFLNGKAAENRKMGILLDHGDLNEKDILNTLRKISEPEYTRNAQYVSNIYRNRQNSPLDTAIYWIEHILELKGNNLTYSPAIDMNAFVYHSLDVISAIGIVILITIFILIWTCKKCFCKRKNEQPKKKKVKFS